MTGPTLFLFLISFLCFAFSKRLRLISGFILVDICLNVALKQILVHFGMWDQDYFDWFLFYHTALIVGLIISLWMFNFFVSRFAGVVLTVSLALMVSINIVSAVLFMLGDIDLSMDYRPIGMRIAMLLQLLAILAEHMENGRGAHNLDRIDRTLGFHRRHKDSHV